MDFLTVHKFTEFSAIYGLSFFRVGLGTWIGSGLTPSIKKILEIFEVHK